ncbi:hypothetical protein ACFL1T_03270, partial [Chlamydiota bacterium]
SVISSLPSQLDRRLERGYDSHGRITTIKRLDTITSPVKPQDVRTPKVETVIPSIPKVTDIGTVAKQAVQTLVVGFQAIKTQVKVSLFGGSSQYSKGIGEDGEPRRMIDVMVVPGYEPVRGTIEVDDLGEGIVIPPWPDDERIIYPPGEEESIAPIGYRPHNWFGAYMPSECGYRSSETTYYYDEHGRITYSETTGHQEGWFFNPMTGSVSYSDIETWSKSTYIYDKETGLLLQVITTGTVVGQRMNAAGEMEDVDDSFRSIYTITKYDSCDRAAEWTRETWYTDNIAGTTTHYLDTQYNATFDEQGRLQSYERMSTWTTTDNATGAVLNHGRSHTWGEITEYDSLNNIASYTEVTHSMSWEGKELITDLWTYTRQEATGFDEEGRLTGYLKTTRTVGYNKNNVDSETGEADPYVDYTVWEHRSNITYALFTVRSARGPMEEVWMMTGYNQTIWRSDDDTVDYQTWQDITYNSNGDILGYTMISTLTGVSEVDGPINYICAALADLWNRNVAGLQDLFTKDGQRIIGEWDSIIDWAQDRGWQHDDLEIREALWMYSPTAHGEIEINKSSAIHRRNFYMNGSLVGWVDTIWDESAPNLTTVQWTYICERDHLGRATETRTITHRFGDDPGSSGKVKIETGGMMSESDFWDMIRDMTFEEVLAYFGYDDSNLPGPSVLAAWREAFAGGDHEALIEAMGVNIYDYCYKDSGTMNNENSSSYSYGASSLDSWETTIKTNIEYYGITHQEKSYLMITDGPSSQDNPAGHMTEYRRNIQYDTRGNVVSYSGYKRELGQQGRSFTYEAHYNRLNQMTYSYEYSVVGYYEGEAIGEKESVTYNMEYNILGQLIAYSMVPDTGEGIIRGFGILYDSLGRKRREVITIHVVVERNSQRSETTYTYRENKVITYYYSKSGDEFRQEVAEKFESSTSDLTAWGIVCIIVVIIIVVVLTAYLGPIVGQAAAVLIAAVIGAVINLIINLVDVPEEADAEEKEKIQGQAFQQFIMEIAFALISYGAASSGATSVVASQTFRAIALEVGKQIIMKLVLPEMLKTLDKEGVGLLVYIVIMVLVSYLLGGITAEGWSSEAALISVKQALVPLLIEVVAYILFSEEDVNGDTQLTSFGQSFVQIASFAAGIFMSQYQLQSRIDDIKEQGGEVSELSDGSYKVTWSDGSFDVYNNKMDFMNNFYTHFDSEGKVTEKMDMYGKTSYEYSMKEGKEVVTITFFPRTKTGESVERSVTLLFDEKSVQIKEGATIYKNQEKTKAFLSRIKEGKVSFDGASLSLSSGNIAQGARVDISIADGSEQLTTWKTVNGKFAITSSLKDTTGKEQSSYTMTRKRHAFGKVLSAHVYGKDKNLLLQVEKGTIVQGDLAKLKDTLISKLEGVVGNRFTIRLSQDGFSALSGNKSITFSLAGKNAEMSYSKTGWFGKTETTSYYLDSGKDFQKIIHNNDGSKYILMTENHTNSAIRGMSMDITSQGVTGTLADFLKNEETGIAGGVLSELSTVLKEGGALHLVAIQGGFSLSAKNGNLSLSLTEETGTGLAVDKQKGQAVLFNLQSKEGVNRPTVGAFSDANRGILVKITDDFLGNSAMKGRSITKDLTTGKVTITGLSREAAPELFAAMESQELDVSLGVGFVKITAQKGADQFSFFMNTTKEGQGGFSAQFASGDLAFSFSGRFKGTDNERGVEMARTVRGTFSALVAGGYMSKERANEITIMFSNTDFEKVQISIRDDFLSNVESVEFTRANGENVQISFGIRVGKDAHITTRLESSIRNTDKDGLKTTVYSYRNYLESTQKSVEPTKVREIFFNSKGMPEQIKTFVSDFGAEESLITYEKGTYSIQVTGEAEKEALTIEVSETGILVDNESVTQGEYDVRVEKEMLFVSDKNNPDISWRIDLANGNIFKVEAGQTSLYHGRRKTAGLIENRRHGILIKPLSKLTQRLATALIDSGKITVKAGMSREVAVQMVGVLIGLSTKKKFGSFTGSYEDALSSLEPLLTDLGIGGLSNEVQALSTNIKTALEEGDYDSLASLQENAEILFSLPLGSILEKIDTYRGKEKTSESKTVAKILTDTYQLLSNKQLTTTQKKLYQSMVREGVSQYAQLNKVKTLGNTVSRTELTIAYKKLFTKAFAKAEKTILKSNRLYTSISFGHEEKGLKGLAQFKEGDEYTDALLVIGAPSETGLLEAMLTLAGAAGDTVKEVTLPESLAGIKNKYTSMVSTAWKSGLASLDDYNNGGKIDSEKVAGVKEASELANTVGFIAGEEEKFKKKDVPNLRNFTTKGLEKRGFSAKEAKAIIGYLRGKQTISFTEPEAEVVKHSAYTAILENLVTFTREGIVGWKDGKTQDGLSVKLNAAKRIITLISSPEKWDISGFGDLKDLKEQGLGLLNDAIKAFKGGDFAAANMLSKFAEVGLNLIEGLKAVTSKDRSLTVKIDKKIRGTLTYKQDAINRAGAILGNAFAQFASGNYSVSMREQASGWSILDHGVEKAMITFKDRENGKTVLRSVSITRKGDGWTVSGMSIDSIFGKKLTKKFLAGSMFTRRTLLSLGKELGFYRSASAMFTQVKTAFMSKFKILKLRDSAMKEQLTKRGVEKSKISLQEIKTHIENKLAVTWKKIQNMDHSAINDLDILQNQFLGLVEAMVTVQGSFTEKLTDKNQVALTDLGDLAGKFIDQAWSVLLTGADASESIAKVKGVVALIVMCKSGNFELGYDSKTKQFTKLDAIRIKRNNEVRGGLRSPEKQMILRQFANEILAKVGQKTLSSGDKKELISMTRTVQTFTKLVGVGNQITLLKWQIEDAKEGKLSLFDSLKDLKNVVGAIRKQNWNNTFIKVYAMDVFGDKDTALYEVLDLDNVFSTITKDKKAETRSLSIRLNKHTKKYYAFLENAEKRVEIMEALHDVVYQSALSTDEGEQKMADVLCSVIQEDLTYTSSLFALESIEPNMIRDVTKELTGELTKCKLRYEKSIIKPEENDALAKIVGGVNGRITAIKGSFLLKDITLLKADVVFSGKLAFTALQSAYAAVESGDIDWGRNALAEVSTYNTLFSMGIDAYAESVTHTDIIIRSEAAYGALVANYYELVDDKDAAIKMRSMLSVVKDEKVKTKSAVQTFVASYSGLVSDMKSSLRSGSLSSFMKSDTFTIGFNTVKKNFLLMKYSLMKEEKNILDRKSVIHHGKIAEYEIGKDDRGFAVLQKGPLQQIKAKLDKTSDLFLSLKESITALDVTMDLDVFDALKQIVFTRIESVFSAYITTAQTAQSVFASLDKNDRWYSSIMPVANAILLVGLSVYELVKCSVLSSPLVMLVVYVGSGFETVLKPQDMYSDALNRIVGLAKDMWFEESTAKLFEQRDEKVSQFISILQSANGDLSNLTEKDLNTIQSIGTRLEIFTETITNIQQAHLMTFIETADFVISTVFTVVTFGMGLMFRAGIGTLGKEAAKKFVKKLGVDMAKVSGRQLLKQAYKHYGKGFVVRMTLRGIGQSFLTFVRLQVLYMPGINYAVHALFTGKSLTRKGLGGAYMEAWEGLFDLGKEGQLFQAFKMAVTMPGMAAVVGGRFFANRLMLTNIVVRARILPQRMMSFLYQRFGGTRVIKVIKKIGAALTQKIPEFIRTRVKSAGKEVMAKLIGEYKHSVGFLKFLITETIVREGVGVLGTQLGIKKDTLNALQPFYMLVAMMIMPHLTQADTKILARKIATIKVEIQLGKAGKELRRQLKTAETQGITFKGSNAETAQGAYLVGKALDHLSNGAFSKAVICLKEAGGYGAEGVNSLIAEITSISGKEATVAKTEAKTLLKGYSELRDGIKNAMGKMPRFKAGLLDLAIESIAIKTDGLSIGTLEGVGISKETITTLKNEGITTTKELFERGVEKVAELLGSTEATNIFEAAKNKEGDVLQGIQVAIQVIEDKCDFDQLQAQGIETEVYETARDIVNEFRNEIKKDVAKMVAAEKTAEKEGEQKAERVEQGMDLINVRLEMLADKWIDRLDTTECDEAGFGVFQVFLGVYSEFTSGREAQSVENQGLVSALSGLIGGEYGLIRYNKISSFCTDKIKNAKELSLSGRESTLKSIYTFAKDAVQGKFGAEIAKSEATKELCDAIDTMISDYKVERDSLVSEAVTPIITTLKNEINKNETEIQAKETKLNRLTNELVYFERALEKETDADARKVLHNEIQGFKAEIATLETEIGNTKTKLTEAKTKLRTLSIEKTAEKIKSKQNEIEVLQEGLTKEGITTEAADGVKQKIASIKYEIQTLKGEQEKAIQEAVPELGRYKTLEEGLNDQGKAEGLIELLDSKCGISNVESLSLYDVLRLDTGIQLLGTKELSSVDRTLVIEALTDIFKSKDSLTEYEESVQTVMESIAKIEGPLMQEGIERLSEALTKLDGMKNTKLAKTVLNLVSKKLGEIFEKGGFDKVSQAMENLKTLSTLRGSKRIENIGITTVQELTDVLTIAKTVGVKIDSTRIDQALLKVSRVETPSQVKLELGIFLLRNFADSQLRKTGASEFIKKTFGDSAREIITKRNNASARDVIDLVEQGIKDTLNIEIKKENLDAAYRECDGMNASQIEVKTLRNILVTGNKEGTVKEGAKIVLDSETVTVLIEKARDSLVLNNAAFQFLFLAAVRDVKGIDDALDGASKTILDKSSNLSREIAGFEGFKDLLITRVGSIKKGSSAATLLKTVLRKASGIDFITMGAQLLDAGYNLGKDADTLGFNITVETISEKLNHDVGEAVATEIISKLLGTKTGESYEKGAAIVREVVGTLVEGIGLKNRQFIAKDAGTAVIYLIVKVATVANEKTIESVAQKLTEAEIDVGKAAVKSLKGEIESFKLGTEKTIALKNVIPIFGDALSAAQGKNHTIGGMEGLQGLVATLSKSILLSAGRQVVGEGIAGQVSVFSELMIAEITQIDSTYFTGKESCQRRIELYEGVAEAFKTGDWSSLVKTIESRLGKKAAGIADIVKEAKVNRSLLIDSLAGNIMKTLGIKQADLGKASNIIATLIIVRIGKEGVNMKQLVSDVIHELQSKGIEISPKSANFEKALRDGLKEFKKSFITKVTSRLMGDVSDADFASAREIVAGVLEKYTISDIQTKGLKIVDEMVEAIGPKKVAEGNSIHLKEGIKELANVDKLVNHLAGELGIETTSDLYAVMKDAVVKLLPQLQFKFGEVGDAWMKSAEAVSLRKTVKEEYGEQYRRGALFEIWIEKIIEVKTEQLQTAKSPQERSAIAKEIVDMKSSIVEAVEMKKVMLEIVKGTLTSELVSLRKAGVGKERIAAVEGMLKEITAIKVGEKLDSFFGTLKEYFSLDATVVIKQKFNEVKMVNDIKDVLSNNIMNKETLVKAAKNADVNTLLKRAAIELKVTRIEGIKQELRSGSDKGNTLLQNALKHIEAKGFTKDMLNELSEAVKNGKISVLEVVAFVELATMKMTGFDTGKSTTLQTKNQRRMILGLMEGNAVVLATAAGKTLAFTMELIAQRILKGEDFNGMLMVESEAAVTKYEKEQNGDVQIKEVFERFGMKVRHGDNMINEAKGKGVEGFKELVNKLKSADDIVMISKDARGHLNNTLAEYQYSDLRAAIRGVNCIRIDEIHKTALARDSYIVGSGEATVSQEYVGKVQKVMEWLKTEAIEAKDIDVLESELKSGGKEGDAFYARDKATGDIVFNKEAIKVMKKYLTEEFNNTMKLGEIASVIRGKEAKYEHDYLVEGSQVVPTGAGKAKLQSVFSDRAYLTAITLKEVAEGGKLHGKEGALESIKSNPTTMQSSLREMFSWNPKAHIAGASGTVATARELIDAMMGIDVYEVSVSRLEVETFTELADMVAAKGQIGETAQKGMQKNNFMVRLDGSEGKEFLNKLADNVVESFMKRGSALVYIDPARRGDFKKVLTEKMTKIMADKFEKAGIKKT